jgi:hypothetical protein
MSKPQLYRALEQQGRKLKRRTGDDVSSIAGDVTQKLPELLRVGDCRVVFVEFTSLDAYEGLQAGGGSLGSRKPVHHGSRNPLRHSPMKELTAPAGANHELHRSRGTL